ncbi:MAG: type 4a pilus biogenesis protein PilO [Oscillospiraceae bacterium]
MNIDLKELRTNRSLQKIIALAIIIILFVFLSVKNFGKMSQLNTDIENMRTEVAVLESRIEYLKVLSQKEESITAQMKALEARLPKSVGQKELLSVIDELCKKYKVEISQVAFEPAVEFLDFHMMNIQLDLSAEYANAMNMLNSLTDDYSLMNISSISATGFDGGKVKVQATVAVYYG